MSNVCNVLFVCLTTLCYLLSIEDGGGGGVVSCSLRILIKVNTEFSRRLESTRGLQGF
jgi:hypothetical protein